MLKHVLLKYTPLSSHKATRVCFVRSSPTNSTITHGEEVDKHSEATVFPKQKLRLRRITPTELSKAVTRRKKLSRPFTPPASDEDHNEEKAEEVPVYKNKKRVSRTDMNNWRLRYDKIPIAERDELVSYVSEKLGNQASITRPFQDAYTAPSVIGIAKEDVDFCYDRLLEVGFKRGEAAAILPYLPSCLVLDFVSLKRMCDLLMEYGVGWRLFLYDHCHCLFLPTAIVSANCM